MKIPLIFAIGVLSWTAAIAETPDPPDTVGRIAFVAGSVGLHADRSFSAEPVEVNWPTSAGDRIQTGAGSRTELSVSAATLRLEEASSLTIIELAPAFARLRLDEGLVLVHVPDRQRSSVVRLESATSAVELNAPGEYHIQVDAEGITHTVVQAGHAKVRTPLLRFQQYAGEQVQIAADGTIEVSTAKSRKQFVDQNIARARHDRGIRSEPHVARNLVGYEELDAHGTWRWEREYGMVWEPRATRANWAPFRFGHWIWKAPWGWTWVDDAPWGFATSHYGRWVKIEGRWKWMAGARQIDAVYAPALVEWLRDPLSPELVGWLPLAPGRKYVPLYPASDAHRRKLNATVSVAQSDRSRDSANTTLAEVSDGVTWTPRTAFRGHSLPTDTHVAADPGVLR